MKVWWNRLSDRERWLLVGGSVLLGLLLLYGLIWQPFRGRLKGLQQAVAQHSMELSWMRQAAKEIHRLESAGPATNASQVSDGRSLLILVDQTAKAAGLGSAVKRVEPQNDDQLRVQLEQVSFDKMVLWLGTLKEEYGVLATNAMVEPQSESGQVNARLVLQGKGS
jgi:general secretion pathway protein M